MKKTTFFVYMLTVIVLAACAPATTPTPSDTPQPTFTLTPAPTATETITPTITPQPTPMGGGTLKVAFYAEYPDGRYLIVGDYFSGKIDYKIPVRNIAPAYDVSWSPDGAHILFVDPPVTASPDGCVGTFEYRFCDGPPPIQSIQPVVWDAAYQIVAVPQPDKFVEIGLNVSALAGVNVEFTSIQLSTPQDVVLDSFRACGHWSRRGNEGGGQ